MRYKLEPPPMSRYSHHTLCRLMGPHSLRGMFRQGILYKRSHPICMCLQDTTASMFANPLSCISLSWMRLYYKAGNIDQGENNCMCLHCIRCRFSYWSMGRMYPHRMVCMDRPPRDKSEHLLRRDTFLSDIDSKYQHGKGSCHRSCISHIHRLLWEHKRLLKCFQLESVS